MSMVCFCCECEYCDDKDSCNGRGIGRYAEPYEARENTLTPEEIEFYLKEIEKCEAVGDFHGAEKAREELK